MYDIIIVGAGPAGISAGIYAVSRGCSTLVLEQSAVGGIIGGVSSVTHYAGIVDGETGPTFACRLRSQAAKAGVEIAFERVTGALLASDIKTVVTDQGIYETANVILANGSTPRALDVPGEAELAGIGCGLNAVRDGERFRDRNVYVVGGADGAVKEALYLAKLAKRVTIVCVEDELACIDEFRRKVVRTPSIEVRAASGLGALRGTERVEELDLISLSDGSVKTVVDPGCGVFVYAGSTPNTALYADQLQLENGYIPVNDRMETARTGVFAAGDIRVKQVRQVATAVSDGAVAAINAAARRR